MHGFKSFANKEVMKLGQGITTVVGPNGCGKTNIVDAIRWVLGEQKYSILRSGKMEDVIFNGAENTKPLGVCEVSMTVHNNSGKLPIEYNDIEIARRVYRSGESEYYLNKTQCRLKDIMDLFVDTGMGADAYSVIELKMIEQILSETADDRRKMFEEAAGIHKYRTQKKTTLRKFQGTKNDLERIKDIIAEVEQKVRGLELQLKRFKRHASLTETLQRKDLELAFLQIHRFRSQAAPMEAKIKEYRHLRESKTNESSIYEKELRKLKEEYKAQEGILNNLHILMNDLNEKRESLRNKILVSSEQARGSIFTVERLEREKGNNFKKIESLKQLNLDFAKEMIELEPAIDQYLEIYKTQKEKFAHIEKNYKKKVRELDESQNQRWELRRKLSDDNSLLERTKAMLIEKKLENEQLNKDINKFNEEWKNQTKIENKARNEKKSSDNEIQKTKKIIDSLNSEIKLCLKKLSDISEDKHAVKALINSLQGQKEFYNELLESREGFPEGTRYVLENPKSFPLVLGTVADMFQVSEKYRDALEVGLGDLSHSLITKDRVSAISILKKANEFNAGDLTIIPLKEAKKLNVQLKNQPKLNQNIKRASDIVKTSEKLKPLAEYLLGNLFIVDDLDATLDSQTIGEYDIVDLNGNYSGNDIILKNRKLSEHGNVMGRQKKLDLILKEIDGLLKRKEKLEKQSIVLQKKLKILQNDFEKNNNNMDHINQIVTSHETNLVRSQFILKQVDKQINISKKHKIDLTAEITQANKAVKSLEPKIKKLNQKLEKFEDTIDKLNDSMLTSRKEKDDFQQSLQDSRIKLIELESRRDQLNFKKSSGEDTSKELVARQEKIDREIDELKEKKKELTKKIEISESELDKISAEIQKQRSILDLKQSVYRETFQNIEEVQARISSEQRDRERLLEDLKNSEIEATQMKQNIIIIEERIEDRYNISVPQNMVVDNTEEQIELEVAKIQRSLDNIGPVNMAVQDEYDSELERFELLTNQRDDLFEAEENLRETIRKIDKVARKRFQETFDLIKSNFENLFNLFFEGGNATLRLIGDPDPLEADIAIDAQPPGKRNSSLRLLSSGEKALTAISLLFAIYQVKPSPYCILDEVDAPLDDVNIHKFARVLNQFCDETQFIIVTHNKLTMEIADYMYGVTQEKKGISKLVSVKFD
ncbi:MAG: chromosome segregation protein SMC [Candidatus Marinimicrobia bacterium]|nr:chromosome segregation protein SMC [Candidatus Neomarinimicrobiota bacterium]